MAWSATLGSISDPPVPTGAKDVAVTFAHTDGRTIARRYNLHGDIFPTSALILAFLQSEIAKLDALDGAADDLEAVIGHTITPTAVTPGDAFPVLTAVQVRVGLLQILGVSAAQVQAVIDAIPDAVQREIAHTYWDYSTKYHRRHPLVAFIATALSLDEAAVDAAWRAAATIE